MPSWRNDIAARIAARSVAGAVDPAHAAKAAEGCAAIEPEDDLVEEVLRLRGLDAVPPVRCRALAPVPPATLTPRAAAHRARPPHAGGARPGGVRHVQLHGAAEAALFGATPDELRLSNPIAADLDQLRPTPLATLALAAQRNAARG